MCAAALALASYGCGVKFFNAQPPAVGQGPSKVKLDWRIWNGNGDLSADKPVTPPLNPKIGVNQQGTLDVTVCETTTFTLDPRYAPERKLTVTVSQPCSCKQEMLTFAGECDSALSGPNYGQQTVSANNIGIIDTLTTDADFPIHVQHAGADIALQAGDGPIFPVPPGLPIAGDYKIYVPGQVGLEICKGAPGGPTGGGEVFAAPVVHVTIVPTCPK